MIRRFFIGLSGLPTSVRSFADLIWFDIFPSTTRQLSEWEVEFGLPNTGLTEPERRERLANSWASQGGQTVAYIQSVLNGAGFDVKVWESVAPGDVPPAGSATCPTVINPLAHLDPTSTDPVPPLGYALPNGTYVTEINNTMECGELVMECGEPEAECGQYSGYSETPTPHIVTNDPDKNPFYLYISGDTINDVAQIPQIRRQEFEELCLRIRPTSSWLGLKVEYI